MARVSYLDVREAMVTYARGQVIADSKNDTYKISSNYTKAIRLLGTIPVSVLIKFARFVSHPELSETGYSFTRAADFELLFAAKALNDDAADTLLCQALEDFEWYLNDREPGYAFNTTFTGYSIEKIEVEQGEVGRNKEAGLIGWMKVTAFIMED